jgi:hypothetical protein
MLRKAGLISLVLLSLLSTGCIDIFSARDAVTVEEDDELNLGKVTKLSLSYQFETTPAIGSMREEGRENVYVKELTQWVQFEIDTQFEVIEPIPGAIEEYIEDRPRWLDVTIWNAESDVVFSAHYNTTVHGEVLVFNTPAPGLWQLEYTARGIGHELLILGGKSYYDGFNLRARALEPT